DLSLSQKHAVEEMEVHAGEQPTDARKAEPHEHLLDRLPPVQDLGEYPQPDERCRDVRGQHDGIAEGERDQFYPPETVSQVHRAASEQESDHGTDPLEGYG